MQGLREAKATVHKVLPRSVQVVLYPYLGERDMKNTKVQLNGRTVIVDDFRVRGEDLEVNYAYWADTGWGEEAETELSEEEYQQLQDDCYSDLMLAWSERWL